MNKSLENQSRCTKDLCTWDGYLKALIIKPKGANKSLLPLAHHFTRLQQFGTKKLQAGCLSPSESLIILLVLCFCFMLFWRLLYTFFPSSALAFLFVLKTGFVFFVVVAFWVFFFWLFDFVQKEWKAFNYHLKVKMGCSLGYSSWDNWCPNDKRKTSSF